MFAVILFVVGTYVGVHIIHISECTFIVIGSCSRLAGDTAIVVYNTFVGNPFEYGKIVLSTIRQVIGEFVKLTAFTWFFNTATQIEVEFPFFDGFVAKLSLIIKKLIVDYISASI